MPLDSRRFSHLTDAQFRDTLLKITQRTIDNLQQLIDLVEAISGDEHSAVKAVTLSRSLTNLYFQLREAPEAHIRHELVNLSEHQVEATLLLLALRSRLCPQPTSPQNSSSETPALTSPQSEPRPSSADAPTPGTTSAGDSSHPSPRTPTLP